MNKQLSMNDLVELNGEPRILDLRLAEILGFDRPRKIRELVERNAAELRNYGELVQMDNTNKFSPNSGLNTEGGKQRGRPTPHAYLNEAQSLLICVFSRTPNASEVRKALITTYLAWRRGEILPAVVDPQAPAPIDRQARDLAILEHVRLTKGPAAAARLYDTMATMPKIPLELPPPLDADAVACLRHLFAIEIEEHTVREWLERAFLGKERARTQLNRAKIEIREDGFVVPSINEIINEAFQATPWPRPFEHLRKLPGSKPFRPGGGRYAQLFTFLPSTYLSSV